MTARCVEVARGGSAEHSSAAQVAVAGAAPRSAGCARGHGRCLGLCVVRQATFLQLAAVCLPACPIAPAARLQRRQELLSPQSRRKVNAFELIKSGLDISGLFEAREDVVTRHTRFSSRASLATILASIENAAVAVGGRAERRDEGRQVPLPACLPACLPDCRALQRKHSRLLGGGAFCHVGSPTCLLTRRAPLSGPPSLPPLPGACLQAAAAHPQP